MKSCVFYNQYICSVGILGNAKTAVFFVKLLHWIIVCTLWTTPIERTNFIFASTWQVVPKTVYVSNKNPFTIWILGWTFIRFGQRCIESFSSHPEFQRLISFFHSAVDNLQSRRQDQLQDLSGWVIKQRLALSWSQLRRSSFVFI